MFFKLKTKQQCTARQGQILPAVQVSLGDAGAHCALIVLDKPGSMSCRVSCYPYLPTCLPAETLASGVVKMDEVVQSFKDVGTTGR